MNGVMLEEEWKENYRMSSRRSLSGVIPSECTNIRVRVSVEKQMAVTLYYLSAEGRCRKAVSVIVRVVCTVMSAVLGPQYTTTLD